MKFAEGLILFARHIIIITLIHAFGLNECVAENLSAAAHQALRSEIVLSRDAIGQGEAVLASVKTYSKNVHVTGTFAGTTVYFTESEIPGVHTGLFGIDMTIQKDLYPLTVFFSDGSITETEQIEVRIRKRTYETEKLSFPAKMVELDRPSEVRAENEAAQLRAIWERASGERLWNGSFILPVTGDIKANFGKKRMINGTEKSPHNGVDISAPLNTKVVSPNRGRIVLTADHFFGGNTIVIDHGQGFYTAYLHLQETAVKEGNIVKKGDLIGLVGETGRSKGPHLHWSARINNARVDPLTLLLIK